jgi:flavorubredoxin
MTSCYRAAPGIDVLTSSFPIPGFGVVPINAFVLHGPEPVLVDTGAVVQSEQFLAALAQVINPGDLKWIWLTHTDFDHIGGLHPILEANPDVKVITNFLSVGIMSLSAPLPIDRVWLVNPGQKVAVGDRTLTAVKPPTWDNPSTIGFLDDQTGALFSSDCFGALLSDVPESAAELSDQELRQGQVFWATVDSPWLHSTDRALFAKNLNAVREMNPTLILSSHLPAAPGHMTDRLIASLDAVPEADPFNAPDQAGLEEMLAQMTGP